VNDVPIAGEVTAGRLIGARFQGPGPVLRAGANVVWVTDRAAYLSIGASSSQIAAHDEFGDLVSLSDA